MKARAREKGRITAAAVAVRLAVVLAVCIVLRLAADTLGGGAAVSVPDKLGENILLLTLPGPGPEFPDLRALTLSATLPAAGNAGGEAAAPSARSPERKKPGKFPAAAPEGEAETPQPDNTEIPPTDGGEGDAAAAPEPSDPGSGAPQNDAIGTTITGQGSSYQDIGEGVYLNNKTDYEIDLAEYLSRPLGFSASDGAAVLIIHTHGSEAYNPAGEDVYVPSDPSRTEDKNFNVVRVGDELTKVLSDRGVAVIHDRQLYDYPSYTGSYDRSMESIRAHLAENPEIRVVIDLHRDALEGDGKLYKTVADVGDTPCAQVMLICGTDYSGLDHPDWRDNLTFALKIQREMVSDYPTLARPLKLSEYRYNQNATKGSLIAEIGTNGNTLQEALTAVRYFGEALADVLTQA